MGFDGSMLSILSIQWISILSILGDERKTAGDTYPFPLRTKVYRRGEERGKDAGHERV
jgi:hypothetical protein